MKAFEARAREAGARQAESRLRDLTVFFTERSGPLVYSRGSTSIVLGAMTRNSSEFLGIPRNSQPKVLGTLEPRS